MRQWVQLKLGHTKNMVNLTLPKPLQRVLSGNDENISTFNYNLGIARAGYKLPELQHELLQPTPLVAEGWVLVLRFVYAPSVRSLMLAYSLSLPSALEPGVAASRGRAGEAPGVDAAAEYRTHMERLTAERAWWRMGGSRTACGGMQYSLHDMLAAAALGSKLPVRGTCCLSP